MRFEFEDDDELTLTREGSISSVQDRAQKPPASHCLFPPSSADRTWAYSFSGAVLFFTGFLIGLLCYLSYRYITKPPVPPNSLVSHLPTWG